MDARVRRVVGWVVAAVGVVVAVVGGLAAQLGLGDDEFGPRQLAAVAVGAALVVVGVVLALWRTTQAEPNAGAVTDTAPSPGASGPP